MHFGIVRHSDKTYTTRCCEGVYLGIDLPGVCEVFYVL